MARDLSESIKLMNRRRVIYEGKAKVLFEGPEPGLLIQYFKDDATAFNAKKLEVLNGKGVLNNRISAYLMTRLSEIGVPENCEERIAKKALRDSAARTNPRAASLAEMRLLVKTSLTKAR